MVGNFSVDRADLGAAARPVSVACAAKEVKTGEPGQTIISWQIDRESYRASPLMSDGTVGPMLELRELFVQFQLETS